VTVGRSRTKVAARPAVTTDVTRPRHLALAALGAAIGAGAALASGALPSDAGKPLAQPHAAAGVTCASCHDAPATATTSAVAHPAAAACKTCHANAPHTSSRAPHRALAARGELTCATCHLAHEGAQGVTFEPGASVVRWGAGASSRVPTRTAAPPGAKKTTVPLVALSVCASCHDVSRASDPVSRCVPGAVRARAPSAGADEAARTAWGSLLTTTASACFDEHRADGAADDRFVAWDAAREVAAATPWVGKPEGAAAPPWSPLGAAAVGAGVLGAAGALARKRRTKSDAPRAPDVVPAARKRLPVIDASTCLGCYACVDACPFDVLAIERYVAVVAKPDECCGVVLCAQVCPNGSLTIAEGELAVDRPIVDAHLESVDVPGLYVAGDLTGLPLIKNAINQGVRVVDHIAGARERTQDPSVSDIVVVGAGPAGLSAALRAREKGLRCVVLEQATVAASIKSFPREKLVYDPPLGLPLEGELWLREATKEELVAQWTRIVRSRAVDVRESRRVLDITRSGDAFEITAAAGESGAERETFRARRVILAIGRRGTPRKLDVAIEPGSESRVSYALADARSFAGRRVVIAGLGDTAMEAAVALARQPGTTVTLTHRGTGFTRGKARNVAEVKDLVAKGRLRLHFETVPVAVTSTTVVVSAPSGGGRRAVLADALLVLAGGEPSWALLERCGIRRPAVRPAEGAALSVRETHLAPES